ncbi:peptidase C39 family protein [Nocardioides taihuensis]|uniref:Peptidase C39 family protein n=1 Tax=Nocardioides taihuensis TaxID=1835606 RepID=A0ABW0BES0_9ACTN
MTRRQAALAALLALALATPQAATATATTAGAAPVSTPRVATRHVDYHAWDTQARLADGRATGVEVRRGAVTVAAEPAGHRKYDGRRYATGRWVSPWHAPGFGYTELVASWQARTPGDSFVEVAVRGRTAAGRVSSWDLLGRWAAGDRHVDRRTVSGQSDDLAGVAVDTWRVEPDRGLAGYQLRVTLLRGRGSTGPVVDGLGAVASRLPATAPGTSRPGPGSGTVLDVPRYSQMVHSGHYPRWGGGGQAWCSPTSTSMVLGYYDALPPAKAWSWIPDGHTDPWVDFAARATYDHGYDGTGNWPFNTAYAATRTGHAFVTRLRNLREAGRFIEAGIPVVASISFGSGELDGAPISASDGHLLVVVGFTRAGDVVVNDPAAQHRRGVRRTYDRAQFEDAWLPTSGGTAYIVRDDTHPLPTGASPGW